MAEEEIVKRPPGRPKGSPNKAKIPKEDALVVVEPTKEDVLKLIDTNTVDFEPTEHQRAFAVLILRSDKPWRYTEVAREIGVGEEAVRKWFNSTPFRVWYENLRAQFFLLYTAPIDHMLIRKAMEGSFKHMELYYNLKGDIIRMETEKSERARQIDSMGVSEQFQEFTQKTSVIIGRFGLPQPVGEIPPRIDVVSTDEDEEKIPGDVESV